jgi:hypothetical protein
MRMSEFWTLVDEEFGPGQGRALVRDHVLGSLAHRTAEQALAAGEDAREVWLALCDDLQVPPERQWGRDQAGDRGRASQRGGSRSGGRSGPGAQTSRGATRRGTR